MTRPEAIAALRERLAEVQRCTRSFGAVLPQTNQPGPLAFFPSVLERIRLILENEHEGATGNLAAALVEVRKDIRRHPLPDLDPDLDERTQALFLLRGERGNLIEALENALDACNVLAMPLRASPEGDLELPREAVQYSLLRALDERLRRLDSSVTRLEEAAAKADTNSAAAGANHSVNQNGLINLSVRELKVDIAAARFEAKSASDPGAPPTIDLGALARSLEAIRDTARELRELVQTLQTWVAPAVVAAGRLVAAGAERAWRGLKTLVRKVRYEREPSPQAPDAIPEDHSNPFRPPLEPRVRDADSGALLATLTGNTGPVFSVGFSPDGARLVSGGDDGTLRLWDAASGALLATLTGHEGAVYSVGFSPDGKRLVSGSDDRTLRIWDAASGALLATLTGHQGAVLSVGFSPDGARLVSGSGDYTLRLWDAASGAPLATLRGHQGAFHSVSFSPHGTLLVSGSHDRTLRLWDAASGALLATLTGHEFWVSSVGFSPDGARLVSGSSDHTLRLWDAASGAPLATLRGHEGWVTSVSFSPNGKRLVSGGEDDTLRLWDAASGALLATLTGHEGAVNSVGFSPDGKRLVSGGGDGTVRLWDATIGAI
jgi:WD40 repeat protein